MDSVKGEAYTYAQRIREGPQNSPGGSEGKFEVHKVQEDTEDTKEDSPHPVSVNPFSTRPNSRSLTVIPTAEDLLSRSRPPMEVHSPEGVEVSPHSEDTCRDEEKKSERLSLPLKSVTRHRFQGNPQDPAPKILERTFKTIFHHERDNLKKEADEWLSDLDLKVIEKKERTRDSSCGICYELYVKATPLTHLDIELREIRRAQTQILAELAELKAILLNSGENVSITAGVVKGAVQGILTFGSG